MTEIERIFITFAKASNDASNEATASLIGVIIIFLIVVVLIPIAIIPYLKKRVGKYVGTSYAKVIGSDFHSADIGVVYSSLFGKTGALNTDKAIILLNRKTVKYYYVYDKKGVTHLTRDMVDVFFGAIGTAMVDHFLGEKIRLCFIELNNGKRVLIKLEDHYYVNYIDAKCKKGKIDDANEKWIQKVIQKTFTKL